MRVRSLLTFFVVTLFFGSSSAWAQFPNNPTFNTVFISVSSGIEGLTGDNSGNLYVVDRGDGSQHNCNVWRTTPNSMPGDEVNVGRITGACRPSGIAFDANGNLFITSTVGIYKLTPSDSGPLPDGDLVITHVPGNNGIAFDADGNLWISDGTTNEGRVWKVTNPDNADCTLGSELNCKEVFRIQPMRNDDNVGRQAVDYPPGAAQDIVANGLAFDSQGNLFVGDTARGAIWKVTFKSNGMLKSKTGCDKTFTDDTLCMDNIYIAHPWLEGPDGIALDQEGNIWVDANERNAIVVVTPSKQVVEVFRNKPDMTTGLRNEGPVEFPTSPFLSGTTFCTTNADYGRRDNAPNSGGEVSGGRGKINCIRQNLSSAGLPLPVQ
jgi:sugar lactone lactonase YvrE